MSGANKTVVAPGGWHKEAPDWLMEEIKAERMIRGLANIGGMMKDETEEQKVGIAETTLYLHTASMHAPIEHDWVEMYKWCLAKVYKRAKQEELPDMLKEKLDGGLSDEEERKLNDLRRKLYHKRGGEINHPIIDAMKNVFLDETTGKETREPENEEAGKLDQFFETGFEEEPERR